MQNHRWTAIPVAIVGIAVLVHLFGFNRQHAVGDEYIVINEQIQEAAERIKAIILAERCKRERVMRQLKDALGSEDTEGFANGADA